MTKVKVRPFCSPTLAMLALDWPDGGRRDFLGFAISRSPGFRKPGGTEEAESWLPNRVGFDGPEQGREFPSETSPIQKFQWWDARIDDPDRGKQFAYRVWPVVGTPENLRRLEECEGRVTVTIPQPEERGIATYFNRAVVSSQAFSRRFGEELTEAELPRALGWLANGLEQVIPSFLWRSRNARVWPGCTWRSSCGCTSTTEPAPSGSGSWRDACGRSSCEGTRAGRAGRTLGARPSSGVA